MKLNPTLIENVRQPISTAELERRWAATRKAMKKQGLDCLIMQNSNQYLGGYVRWFTDVPAKEGYPVTVIFPVDDEMTMITSGGDPLPPGPPEWAVRGVKERIGRPYFRTLQLYGYAGRRSRNQPAESPRCEEGGDSGQGLHVGPYIRIHPAEPWKDGAR